MRARTLPAFALALVVSGCAVAPRTPATAQPGAVTVQVVDELEEGTDLSRVCLQIDGADVPLTTTPPRGAAANATFRLSPGDHTLGARVVTDSKKSDGHLVVGAERPFYERAEGSILVVHVRGHASSASDGGPIAVDIEEPSSTPSQIAGCATQAPTTLAICRASIAYDHATRAHDAVKAVCIRDKLGEMRRLADLADEHSTPDITRSIDRRVATLSTEADGCENQMF